MIGFLLAAGLGDRLKPLTSSLAKPAIPILNVPMMGFSQFFLEQAGVSEFVFNTHHLPKTIEECALRLARKPKLLRFSHEPTLLASAGGIAQAWQTAGRPQEGLVIGNADAVALFSETNIIQKLIEKNKTSGAVATLLLTPFPKAKESFGGVYVDENHCVKRFSKTKLNEKGLVPWHFTGFMVVSGPLCQSLESKPLNILYEVLQPRIDRGELVNAVIAEDGLFFETGNQSDYLKATEELLAILSTRSAQQQCLIQILDRFDPKWWRGWRTATPDAGALLASLPWPDRLRVKSFAVVGPETWIGSNVMLDRCVVIGEGEIPNDGHFENRILMNYRPSESAK